jgi:hypothetical protein
VIAAAAALLPLGPASPAQAARVAAVAAASVRIPAPVHRGALRIAGRARDGGVVSAVKFDVDLDGKMFFPCPHGA